MAKSQDVVHFFLLAAATLAIALFTHALARALQGSLLIFLERPHSLSLDGNTLGLLLRELGLDLLGMLALPLGGNGLAAVAAHLVQHRPVLAAEKIKPEWRKISPMAGLKRLFGTRGLIEFAKGLVKMLAVAAALYFVLKPSLDSMTVLPALPLSAMLEHLFQLTLAMLGAFLVVMAAVAMLDVFYQRWDFRRSHRMSRVEVKDEARQSEGDPHVKARIRQVRMERGRKRMMAAVPTADVVLANPTHFAIALKYDAGAMAAPRVVAKGLDFIALKIRELAAANDVPVVEDAPLARALYGAVEVDQEIPPQFYRAVAEVIGYVMRLKGKLQPRASERAADDRGRGADARQRRGQAG